MNFYSDRFRGGYVVNGWSPAYDGGGTQSFAVPAPSGSTERRSFLIASRHGAAPNLTVTLQGTPFTFSAANQITSYNDPTYGGMSGMHVIEVTGMFNININNFVLNIPVQPGIASNRYSDFVLYRSFNRSTSSFMNARIELNQYNIQPLSPTWQINLLPPLLPVNTLFPVALGLMCGYVCDCTDDWTRVLLNSSLLGTIGNHHPSFGTCGGPLGAHFYYDNTFTALLTPSGNNVNTPMACADALSNIAPLLTNGATTFALNFNHKVSPPPANYTNLEGAAFIGYHDTAGASPYECPGCTTFTVTNLLPNSATLNWNSIFGPPSPCLPQGTPFINDVYYRVVGNPIWTIVNVNSTSLLIGQTPNSLDISGLNSGTQYEWRIVNINNGGAVCSPSDVYVFWTP